MSTDNHFLFKDNETDNWAEIVLPLALPTVYTYAIPAHLIQIAQPGSRAEVIFGKNKKYAGIIKSVSQLRPSYATKPILNILDDTPILFPRQLQLWNWISDYYMCTEGEVMNAALPVNFKLSSETILLYNEASGDDFTQLDDEEFIVAEALQIKRQLQLIEVQQILDATHVYPVIKRLIEKKVCLIWEKLNERYKPKKDTFIELHVDYEDEEPLSRLLNEWKGSPKQMQLLLSFLHLRKTEGQVSQSSLLKKAEASAAQLKSLCEKKILVAEKRNIDRIKSSDKYIHVDFELTAAQQKAYNEIHRQFEDKNVCLLHGVTGSGKTQVYIKHIELVIQREQQALFLLPEIALTSQIIRRLQKHFGGHVIVYHSKFNDQERVEIWNKIKSGATAIVLGARSAVFLPFSNLGLIIVDEEHDPSYKQQDPAPRYNARDTAIYYASLFGAKVLLGSATPSLE
ncbi:MAG: DEAD/DEAH box helicase, partial [Ferruginibacter sp.]|nr:DEAD/DEAH box helicase [Ferruginibacter sp.]